MAVCLLLLGLSLMTISPAAAARHQSVAEFVGPPPLALASRAPTPILQVFSLAEEHEIGHDTIYRPHTDYLVYSLEGRLVKRVRNAVGIMDETPAIVALRPGSYRVLAQVEGYGRMLIGVVIRPQQTTILHLQRGWQPPAHTNDAEMVKLPDGAYIGWRADPPGKSPAQTQ